MKKIFILILIIVFSIPAISFATTLPSLPNPSQPHYDRYAVFQTGSYYVLVQSANDITVDNSISKKIHLTGSYSLFAINNGVWKLSSNHTSSGSYAIDGIVLANHDIKLFDGSVFFSPPMGLVVAMADNQATMIHQVVGLIPYLILSIILSVGFWKAWQFLSKQLQGA